LKGRAKFTSTLRVEIFEASQALPLLTGAILTEFLARSPKEDQYDILLAFEEWLKSPRW